MGNVLIHSRGQGHACPNLTVFPLVSYTDADQTAVRLAYATRKYPGSNECSIQYIRTRQIYYPRYIPAPCSSCWGLYATHYTRQSPDSVFSIRPLTDQSRIDVVPLGLFLGHRGLASRLFNHFLLTGFLAVTGFTRHPGSFRRPGSSGSPCTSNGYRNHGATSAGASFGRVR